MGYVKIWENEKFKIPPQPSPSRRGSRKKRENKKNFLFFKKIANPSPSFVGYSL
jgi:hypothetical protein